jgi:hypothetical protein
MSTFGRILFATLVVFACSAGSAANTWAQAHENASAAARAHYKDGRANYQLGEYRAAIREFKEAYRLKPDATFLFNIAQCYRQLHEYGEALQLYRNYLRDAPDAKNHEEVERFIREITLLIEQEKESKSTVAPTPAPAAAVSPAVAPPVTAPASPSSTPSAANAAAVPLSPGATPSVPAVAAVPPYPGLTASAPEPGNPALSADSSAAASGAPAMPPAQPRADSITVGPQPPLANAWIPPPTPMRAEAAVEVVTNPSDAKITVNQIAVGSQSPLKLKLPPGLYSMAIERDGYRGSEGALSLLVGDHVSLNVDLKPLKTHGWRGFGTTFVVLGVLSEAIGIVGHVMANRRFAGSPEYNRFSQVEVAGQAVAISSAVLATGCYLLDWLGNRRNVEPGPPFGLEPAKVNP